jgi:hypothetical protein
LGTPSAWRVALSLCVLVIVVTLLQLNSINIPQPGTLTSRITTDKEVYRVGDTVHAEYSYVNNNGWAVTFSPPNSYSGMNGSYEPAGKAFNLCSQDFQLGKVGRFSIWCGSALKIVTVLP